MTPIPTDTRGRVSWKRLFTPDNIGASFLAADLRIPTSAVLAIAHQSGFNIDLQHGPESAVTLTVLSQRGHAKPAAQPIPWKDRDATMKRAIVRDSDSVRKLREARENAAYWIRQKALRTNPAARAEAGALVIAWQMQIQILTA